MRRNDAFPSKWLKPADLVNQAGNATSPVVTIAGVRSHTFKNQNEEKLLRVIALKETDKEIPLNLTNWDSIATITGIDDDDQWVGWEIMLYRKMVESPNGQQWGLRVAPPCGWDKFTVPQPPAAPEQPQPVAAEEPGADDLPF